MHTVDFMAESTPRKTYSADPHDLYAIWGARVRIAGTTVCCPTRIPDSRTRGGSRRPGAGEPGFPPSPQRKQGRRLPRWHYDSPALASATGPGRGSHYSLRYTA